jgi:hypothetical protein
MLERFDPHRDPLEVPPSFERDRRVRSEMNRICKELGWPGRGLSPRQLLGLQSAARLRVKADRLALRGIEQYGLVDRAEWRRLSDGCKRTLARAEKAVASL